MKWKLQRGKWRPRLQALVDELPSDAVVEASTAAFAALAKESAETEAALRAAVNALTVLKVTLRGSPGSVQALAGAGPARRPTLGDLNATGFPVRACQRAARPCPPSQGRTDGQAARVQGVGPATASAVLSAGDPAAPFMSDEALAVLGDRCAAPAHALTSR